MWLLPYGVTEGLGRILEVAASTGLGTDVIGGTYCLLFVMQVYRATLRPELGGGDVAIKVLRPGVLEQVSGERRGCISWRGCA